MDTTLNVQIVDVNGCKKNIVAEVPAETVEQEVDKLAREYAGKVKVPGFRPGKVPLGIVKQRYSTDLWQEATEDIIRRSWKAALAEHNLKPLSEPVVEDIHGQLGQTLKFTVSFEILPALEVKDYRGISVSVDAAKVVDADVDQAVEQLREQHAQFTPVEGAEVHDGHFVSIDADGVFEGGGKPLHQDGYVLVVGGPNTDPVFSENLRGMRVSEVRSFDRTYPSDYHNKRYAGKTVHYTFTLKELKEKQLPELNDDFAKDIGEESLLRLRDRIKDELITKARRAAEKKARDAVLDDIVARHRFDVPECLVQDELKEYGRGFAATLAQQGIDVSQTSIDWKKMFEEQRPRAEQAVRRSIVLDTVARQEGIEVTDSEVDEHVEKIAQSSQKSAAAVRAQLEKDQRIQELRELLRSNKALDFIYSNANITGGDELGLNTDGR